MSEWLKEHTWKLNRRALSNAHSKRINAVVCAAYVGGRSSRPSAVRETSAARVLYYVDPMHPAYRSDRPGKAPDCGMDLVPVYAENRSMPPAATTPGSLRLTPDQEQAASLQTETVQMAPVSHGLQTVGRVLPDESLTYRVSAGVDGWVRRVFSDRTGTHVRRGEALSSFFSRDIPAPQQAYVYALESYERLKHTPSPPADQLALATQQLATTRDNLQFLGMGQAQIDELGRTRGEVVDINLTAPADGQILERHVAVGQRFMKGELLYRIANLERVWVLADVHTGDAALLGAIEGARIRLEGLPPLEARAVITVHADAVIDSGTMTRVFVALGDGQYQLREVETGWQEGDRVEIRVGLKAGERVVTAGAFLLDSEAA